MWINRLTSRLEIHTINFRVTLLHILGTYFQLDIQMAFKFPKHASGHSVSMNTISGSESGSGESILPTNYELYSTIASTTTPATLSKTHPPTSSVSPPPTGHSLTGQSIRPTVTPGRVKLWTVQKRGSVRDLMSTFTLLAPKHPNTQSTVMDMEEVSSGSESDEVGARLVLDAARAQRDALKAEKYLSQCLLKEHAAFARLYSQDVALPLSGPEKKSRIDDPRYRMEGMATPKKQGDVASSIMDMGYRMFGGAPVSPSYESKGGYRTFVELFADGVVQVLVCTATLAWCVDLPAHAVVINAIQIYNPKKGRWVGVSSQDVLQAQGRPAPIESQFMSKLADNLNAEVALGAVRSWDEAVQWLGYAHFSLIVARGTKVCLMLKSPGLYYDVGVDYEEDDNSLVEPTVIQDFQQTVLTRTRVRYRTT
ncbi:hypothetical protein BU15DRAFT_59027 [Melanogaster broomeanus]|nr:hypothetical protein BU15DRAFT_59027 [Melanogaster broomeanus]